MRKERVPAPPSLATSPCPRINIPRPACQASGVKSLPLRARTGHDPNVRKAEGPAEADRSASPKVRLAWEGKGALPVIPKGRLEVVTGGSPDSRLIQGDNLSVHSVLSQDLRGQVMLVYLDPPFFTGRLHEK